MYSDYVKHRAILHYKFIEQSLRKVSAIYKIGKSTLVKTGWYSNYKKKTYENCTRRFKQIC